MHTSISWSKNEKEKIPIGTSSTAAQMKDISRTKGHCIDKSNEMQPVAEYMYNNAEVAVKAPATNPSEPAMLLEVEKGHFLVPNFLIYE